MTSDAVVMELAVTAELCGANLTPAAAKILASELTGQREDDLIAGLKLMRREHTGRFSLAHILNYAMEGKRKRLSELRTCIWCGDPSVTGSDKCEPHTRDSAQADRDRAKLNGSAA